MATARLVYETSEHLDDRTIAHTKCGPVTALAVTGELIATAGNRITVRNIDCSMNWSEEHEGHVMELAFLDGDELVAVGWESVDVWDADGTHLRRFDFGIDWGVSHCAIDRLSGQLALIGEQAEALILDLTAGERLHEWDMTEDYDFGSWIQINGAMFRDGRLVISAGQQMTVWVDGELEEAEWRRGKNLGQHGEDTWADSERYVMEVTFEARGLVIYDAHSLELLAQPGATGDLCGEFDGEVFAWSDQHLSIWNGDVRFLKPDWRGHRHPTFTPDGKHAVSVSLKGEICVQRVADFEVLDAEPERVWAMELATAFATNASGTQAAVLCRVHNESARAQMVDLATGEQSDLGKLQPIETLHFIDDNRVFGVTGRWVNPVGISTWLVGDTDVETLEVPGDYLGTGKGWVATKEGDATVIFHSLEAGQLQEMSRCEAPEGFELQTVISTRWADAWDDNYESVLLDLETGATIVTEEGKVAGGLLARTEWEDDYVLRILDLGSGDEIGEWKGNVDEYLLTQDGKVFFSAEHKLFGWTPPDAPEELFAAPDLGTIKLSSDERYLLDQSAPVRIFDTTAPRDPLLELRLPYTPSGAEVAGDFLLVAGYHGMYSIFAIER